MELYIFNRNLEWQGIIDVFTSLIWTRKYNTNGIFELHLLLTEDNLRLLQRGNIIYKKGDKEAAYIETRNLTVDKNGQELLIVYGKMVTGYLNRRIIMNTINFSGTYENLYRQLVNENCINPSDTNRTIPLLSLENSDGYTDTVNTQITYSNVLDKLTDLSNTSNIGFRINVYPDIKQLKFDVYKGVDRTVNQSAVYPVIFSRDFENILSENYTDSDNNYKNCALIAGAGEGSARKKTIINNDKVGLDRYELFIDARDIQDTKEVNSTDENGNETTTQVPIPDEKYEKLLIQRGNEKINEHKEAKTFDATINIRGNYVYKTDYDLGDIVTVVDKKWGVTVDTRITEIQEVYESNKVEINPTFGSNIPTIIDKLKQLERR